MRLEQDDVIDADVFVPIENLEGFADGDSVHDCRGKHEVRSCNNITAQ